MQAEGGQCKAPDDLHPGNVPDSLCTGGSASSLGGHNRYGVEKHFLLKDFEHKKT
jgi:hypothetical protein